MIKRKFKLLVGIPTINRADLLNEALIDDENETMRGKKYNNIENFHNKLVRL